MQGGRRVEYAIERSLSGDRGQAVLDAALDDLALDLDVGDELEVSQKTFIVRGLVAFGIFQKSLKLPALKCVQIKKRPCM